MPVYKFTAPDGKTYRVNAPEGASEQEAFGVLQQQLAAGSQPPTPAPPPTPAGAAPGAAPGGVPDPAGMGVPPPTDAPPAPAPAAGGPPELLARVPPRVKYDPTEGMTDMQKFLAGAGQSFVSTGRGIRQLWNLGTGDTEELQRLLKEEEEARVRDDPLLSTGAGRTGQITGHITQALVPVGAGAKAATTAGKIGLNAALGAGLAGLAPTVEGESRAENMAWGGGLGAALPGLGQLVRATPLQAKAAIVRAIGRSITENPRVEAIRRGAGEQIDKLTRDLQVPLAPMKKELQRIRSSYGADLPRSVNQQLDQMVQYAQQGAKAKGKLLQEARTAILREADNATGIAKSGLEALRRTLDKGVDSALAASPRTVRDLLFGSRVAALRTARETYKTGKKPEFLRPYVRAAQRGTVEALMPRRSAAPKKKKDTEK